MIKRKEAAAFEINEIRRHNDELARKVDLQFLEGLEIFQVLAGDSFEGNVVDVDLVALDQVKQEVKRAFKNLKLNFVIALHVAEGI